MTLVAYSLQCQDRVAGFSFSCGRNPSLVKTSPVTVLAIVQERSSTEDLCFMGKPKQDLTGRRFGRLVVLEQFYDRSLSSGNAKRCKVLCDCGIIKEVAAGHLTSRHTQSCGCLSSDRTAERNIANSTHGRWQTPEYDAWHSIGQRINNPNHRYFEHYGGRGISLCEGFQSAECFLNEVGKRPTPKHSIDRKDNNGHYSCGKCEECLANGWPMNVRWATKKEQGRNRRDNVLLTIDGQTKCVSEWAEISPVNKSSIHRRLASGMSPREAVLSPAVR